MLLYLEINDTSEIESTGSVQIMEVGKGLVNSKKKKP